jgi:AcrR family transcriptional regulator
MSTDARREQLLQAGVELFDQRGHDEVSIEDIANAAGVSKGLLYHYFPTKRDFIVAALARGRDQLDERLTPEPGLDPLEQLDAGLEGFLENVEEHATAYTAIFRRGGGGDPEIAAELDAGRDRFMRMMLQGVERFQGRPIEKQRRPAVEAALQGWLFFVEGAVLHWLENGGLERARLRDLLRRALIGSLAAAWQAEARD